MGGLFHELLLILQLLLMIVAIVFGSSSVSNYSEVRCRETENQALLKFKQGLHDEGGLLSSWGSTEDCCRSWKGVKCSNKTGHVVKLDLRLHKLQYSFLYDQYYVETTLVGEINPALLKLHHLKYLDLSYHRFNSTNFLNLVSSFTNLRYLNLSNTALVGTISSQLGNLSSLISLDLSNNSMLEVRNLDWLSHLSSLRRFEMSFVNLSMAVNWLQVINTLPSLQHLRLSNCELSMVNSTTLAQTLSNNFNSSAASLSTIDLSVNKISSIIFPWLFRHVNSLVYLDLSSNDLGGPFPDDHAFGEALSLVHLDLSSNRLQGTIPKNLENLRSLQVLDLSHNNLSGEVLIDFTKLLPLKELRLSNNSLHGSLPKSIGKLSKLEVLDVSSNSLDGTVTEVHLFNLSLLRHLALSFNSLTFNFSSSSLWSPTFQLDTLKLSSCRMLEATFPQWLQSQKKLSHLDVSNASISDTIPNWFWDISYNLRYLNLSHNQISGIVQNLSSRFIGFPTIDLSHNKFSGPLSAFPLNTTVLDLSNNSFQGSVSFLCTMTTGTLNYLDLSNNLLSGILPDCLTSLQNLVMFNLANNNLSGTLPESILQLPRIITLHLNNNSFVGEPPGSFRECRYLEVIDIGENKFSGNILPWIEELTYLRVLRLSSNLFSGSIPPQLCHLEYLQVLDVSHNKISGTIPRCLHNITVMTQEQSKEATIQHFYVYLYAYFNRTDGSYGGFLTNYIDNVCLVLKKKGLVYSRNLGLVKAIDLSRNKLRGHIPVELTKLKGLIGLNLSENFLTGNVPREIGELMHLDSLDLSRNQLSGEIPSSLSNLSLLGNLDLSNNNLSGRIPTCTQLQSFDESAYSGNPYLCGDPLPKCQTDEDDHDEAGQGPITGGSDERLWLSASIVLGFILGFWGVSAPLLLNVCWKHSYARYVDRLGVKIHVILTGS
ncbi:hypothetical protein FNV43_RR24002 [Rhamnella rubrinervis]|uniref:Leucine-rich repeat-containing N-terminal plant-type domain-containing protein n=1 Tax=Rhamnella rubrinervis TaxID=2594499 RepID=A0A8K0DS74_9ROSA|nr:hypothetical protein FNV43_RR24002 [Rhamnella rubrinervis]